MQRQKGSDADTLARSFPVERAELADVRVVAPAGWLGIKWKYTVRRREGGGGNRGVEGYRAVALLDRLQELARLHSD